MQLALVTLISSVSAAALIDLESFYSVRKNNPEAKFDWILFAVRVFIGLLTGLAGIGVGTLT
jgi:hypothetical protein